MTDHKIDINVPTMKSIVEHQVAIIKYDMEWRGRAIQYELDALPWIEKLNQIITTWLEVDQLNNTHIERVSVETTYGEIVYLNITLAEHGRMSHIETPIKFIMALFPDDAPMEDTISNDTRSIRCNNRIVVRVFPGNSTHCRVVRKVVDHTTTPVYETSMECDDDDEFNDALNKMEAGNA